MRERILTRIAYNRATISSISEAINTVYTVRRGSQTYLGQIPNGIEEVDGVGEGLC